MGDEIPEGANMGLATTAQITTELLARLELRGYMAKEADLFDVLRAFRERCELDEELNRKTVDL